MADVSHDALLDAFRSRYDFQAARTVLADALKTSGLGQKDSYSDADVATIKETLIRLGEGFTDGIFEALAKSAAAPEKKEAPKKEAPKKEEKKDDDKDEAAKKTTKKATKKASGKK